MAKRSSDPIDRLLGDVADRETQRRIAWARGVEGLTEKERVALVRCLRDGAHKASTADLWTSLAAMDRLGIGDP